MAGSLVEKYAGRSIGNSLRSRHGTDEEGDTSSAADMGCFGWVRAARDRAITLQLRKKTGSIRAIPYGWIERFDFDPSGTITLAVASGSVRITGRNLNTEIRETVRLFDGLTRHRVLWIHERGERASAGAEGTEVFVDSITW